MPAAATKTPARDTVAEIAYLTRALKAPTLRDAVDRLAQRARSENWTHEAAADGAAVAIIPAVRATPARVANRRAGRRYRGMADSSFAGYGRR